MNPWQAADSELLVVHFLVHLIHFFLCASCGLRKENLSVAIWMLDFPVSDQQGDWL